VVLLLAAGYPGLALADETPPPTDTTPAPDPAPPQPKPAPKPQPPAPRPAHVYHAPTVQHSTPAPQPQPTYTPPVVVRHAAKKPVHHAPKHKRRHKRAKPVVVQPKVHAPVKHASVVNIAGLPAASVATNEGDALRRSLVITGMGLAALLFFLVVFVPATAVRFTPPGRVLMDHQTDLVLVGVAILLLTALLFSVTGNA
jgi:hypothetical protein